MQPDGFDFWPDEVKEEYIKQTLAQHDAKAAKQSRRSKRSARSSRRSKRSDRSGRRSKRSARSGRKKSPEKPRTWKQFFWDHRGKLALSAAVAGGLLAAGPTGLGLLGTVASKAGQTAAVNLASTGAIAASKGAEVADAAPATASALYGYLKNLYGAADAKKVIEATKETIAEDAEKVGTKEALQHAVDRARNALSSAGNYTAEGLSKAVDYGRTVAAYGNTAIEAGKGALTVYTGTNQALAALDKGDTMGALTSIQNVGSGTSNMIGAIQNHSKTQQNAAELLYQEARHKKTREIEILKDTCTDLNFRIHKEKKRGIEPVLTAEEMEILDTCAVLDDLAPKNEHNYNPRS